MYAVCRRCTLAMLVLCVLSCTAGADESSGPEPGSAIRDLRASHYQAILPDLARCGENCLYLLARMHGHSISYEQLVDDLAEVRKSGDKSTSLSELCQVGERLGFPCVARRCSMDDFERIRLPVIAHYRRDPDPSAPDTNEGHFVVVVAKDDRGFLLIDGTTTMTHRRTDDEFKSAWTGYVLAAREKKTFMGFGVTELGVMVVFWAGVCWLIGRHNVSRKACVSPGVRGSRIVLSVTAITICLGSASLTRADNAAPGTAALGIWRTPENDGLNCLYLMLHLHGRPATYDSLSQFVPRTEQGATLVELRNAAQQCGLNTRITKRTPSDLAECQFPVLTHLDRGPRTGEVCLSCSCMLEKKSLASSQGTM